MKPHPAAMIFPLLDGAGFDALVDDVKEHGLREPIELLEGKILDGRNRFNACAKLGVRPEFVSLTLDDIGGDPFTYVDSKNRHRRHLTPSQWAMVAADMADRSAHRATSKNAEPNAAHQCADEAAAEVVGVGKRTVQQARRVTREGAAPVGQSVREGAVTVKTAERLVDAVPDKKKQAAIVREAKKKADPDEAVKEAIDAVEFDPNAFAESEAEESANARLPKNGKAVVPVKDRKKAISLHGTFCRSLQKIGIYDEFIVPLSQIMERLKQI